MRTLIVHNARSGFGSDSIFEFERALLQEGDECVTRVLGDDFDLKGALRDAEDFDLVVLSGGDGTVTSILYELRRRDVTCCVFPSGTANLFFNNLGLASEPNAIARACRQGGVIGCDLGEISWSEQGASHTRGFGIMAGTGYDASLMRTAMPDKKSLGEAAYFAAALKNTRPEVSHFSITVDGVRHERDGIACLVANTATMQGEIEIVSDCSVSDGLIDVIVLATSDAVQLIVPFLSGILDRRGRAGRPFIEHFTGREVKVESSSPIPMQIDGDVVADAVTGYVARVLPRANDVVVDQTSPYYQSSRKLAPRD